jgi:hypothetical protein
MNPCRPYRLSAVPRTLHTQLEIAKAIRTLAGPDQDELLRQRRAEIAAIRRELDVLARGIRKLGEELPALVVAELQSELRKYSPNQPRVAAGNPDGGQWVVENGDANRDGSRTGVSSVQTEVRYAADIPLNASNNSEILSDETPDNMWIPGAQYAAGWEHHFMSWATFDKYTLQPETRQVLSTRRRDRLRTRERIAGRQNMRLTMKQSTRPLYPTYRGITFLQTAQSD